MNIYECMFLFFIRIRYIRIKDFHEQNSMKKFREMARVYKKNLNHF